MSTATKISDDLYLKDNSFYLVNGSSNCITTSGTGISSSTTTTGVFTTTHNIEITPNPENEKNMGTLNKIQINGKAFKLEQYQPTFYFTRVKEYCPYKVYGFTFSDGEEIKTVCDEEDSFDFEFSFFLAIAKKLYGKTHTVYGVIDKAHELSLTKKWSKIVEKGIKLYLKQTEEEEKVEEEKRLKKERHYKYIQKKKNRDKRRYEKKLNDLKEVICEALYEAGI